MDHTDSPVKKIRKEISGLKKIAPLRENFNAVDLRGKMNTQSDLGNGSDAPDIAGVIAPPPLIYLSALAIGVLIHLWYPVRFLPRTPALCLGVLLIAVSIPIAVSGFRAMTRAKTAVDPRKPSTAIVNFGVFRYTRNPLYISLMLLYLGIASIINSLWLLILIFPLIAVIQKGVIEREERYLEKKFGEEYLRYKRQVRRWI